MKFNFAVASIVSLSSVMCSADVNTNFNADHTAIINTDKASSSALVGGKPEKIELTKDSNLWEQLKHNFSSTWESDNSELYIPVSTWHNRLTYSNEKIQSYNEIPWGIGYGKYRFDAKNNWHSIYAMVFMDSHNKMEPIAGYGYQKMWIPGNIDEWRFGAGFTLSATARHEYYYIPMPLVLPLISIEYSRLSLQSTYIPGTHNNGNVLFTWLRWQF